MSVEFRMPSLGPDMESGTLVEWRMAPGDQVHRGDVVALVETEKGIIDVEIFTDGVVERLCVDKGAHVPVGTPLAILSGTASATEVTAPDRVAAPQPAAAPTAFKPEAAPSSASPAPHRRLKISPAARVRAQALGVDPAQITGSGSGGAITLEDVELAARTAPSAAPRPFDMRAVIAKAMSRSKREIPHYYLMQTLSFERARAWLDAYNGSVGMEERILPAAVLLKAVARAARSFPDFNGHYTEQGFAAASAVNVGVAVAMRGGRLVAPALLNADEKSIAVLMRELRDLTQRVRSGHMRGSELAQPTLTVTSLADDGPDTVIPVIYPPQVAMIGFGSVALRPWVVEGAVQAIPTVNITLAADHRVTDGRAGARFLAHIRDTLQAPEQL
ncbi:MAG: dihydrolipoamide acetyltransferase family protein [Steroidobacteraceae bacterium]